MRLIDGVNRNLPTFHRYLKLRKRMMGVSELHYYDLYAPLVASVDTDLLGGGGGNPRPGGAGAARRRVRHRGQARVHGALDRSVPRPRARRPAPTRTAAPTTCTRTCCSTTTASTPTSARWRTSSATRCRATSRTRRSRIRWPTIPIFVAEVASTFNEALLIDYMLKNITDDDRKLSLLGNYLEGIKGTVFRQTQFAEFELRSHEMAEKGQPLTGEALSKLYADITRKYYGHDQGICIVDDYVAPRVGVHPPFLPELLRLPVRHVVHRVGGAGREGQGGRPRRDAALSGVPRGGRVEVPD